jgi:hypothetical protein
MCPKSGTNVRFLAGLTAHGRGPGMASRIGPTVPSPSCAWPEPARLARCPASPRTPLTEPTAGARPWWRERVLIRKLVADYDAVRGAESVLNEPSPQQKDK